MLPFMGLVYCGPKLRLILVAHGTQAEVFGDLLAASPHGTLHPNHVQCLGRSGLTAVSPTADTDWEVPIGLAQATRVV